MSAASRADGTGHAGESDTAFAALLRRDLLIAARDSGVCRYRARLLSDRRRADAARARAGPRAARRIAPGILWIALLLAALLATARMFEADAEDGSLDVLALSPLPLEGVALAKILVHWLTVALPLVVAAPLLGLLLNLDLARLRRAHRLDAARHARHQRHRRDRRGADCLGTRKGGLLVALLVLPLYIPTLIFGISSVSAALSGPPGAALSPLLLLAAISLGVHRARRLGHCCGLKGSDALGKT